MGDYRSEFGVWMEFIEVNPDTGIRMNSLNEFTDGWYDQLDVDVSIDKSITSNSDTATITVNNHPILEDMYRNKKAFFEGFNAKVFEVDIMLWYDNDPDTARTNHCIFSGNVDEMMTPQSSSITDQQLVINAVGGKRESVRTITNKRYPSGMTYRQVVEDIFQQFPSYNLTVLDDPLGKLNKPIKRPRTYHTKAVEILDDIARDLEMTWGFDCNPWTVGQRFAGGGFPNQHLEAKHAYFVDKSSIFDVLGLYGNGGQAMNGSTGKLGRIGYGKSTITFEHLTDDRLNIGMNALVSDYGTMNDGVEFSTRVDRLSINNNQTNIEATYVVGGKAVIEENKDNSGALKL